MDKQSSRIIPLRKCAQLRHSRINRALTTSVKIMYTKIASHSEQIRIQFSSIWILTELI